MFYESSIEICLEGDTTNRKCFPAGDLIIENRKGYPIWNAFSDPHIHENFGGVPPFKLVIQNDGNVVMYDHNGSPKWATGTNGK